MRIVFLFVCMLPILLRAIVVPYSREMIKTDTNHISTMEKISPPDKSPIPQKTDTWFWHDEKNLYVYWELEIDGKFYPGAYAIRDDNQNCDYVRFQMKTMKNEDFAYYFSAFPRGTAFDAVRRDNFQIDKAWNSLYYCKSEYTDRLWKVTMVIPFKDLRYEGTPPYHWSFSTARQIDSNNSAYSYPFVPVVNQSIKQYYNSLEELIINEEIEEPQNFRVMPYFYRSYDSLTKTQTFDPDHVGMNLIIRPSNNTSLKMAINPDFTEVPIDEERDSHNDKYPPQLTENRVFFTEDMNAFGVDESVFYSRNIMQPQFAIKYTYSGKNWNMGFLSAKDKKTEDNGTTINPDDMYNIIAFKPQIRDFTNQMTLLTRTNSGYRNAVLYMNPYYQLSPTTSIEAKLAYSNEKYDSLTAINGSYLFMRAVKRYSHVLTLLAIRTISRDYMPGMASYSNQYEKNLNSGHYGFEYDDNFENSYIESLHLDSYGNIVYNREGDEKLGSWDISNNMSLTMQNKLSANASINYGTERVCNTLLDFYSSNATFNCNKWLLCNFYLGAGHSDAIVYRLAETRNNNNLYWGINGFIGPIISYIFRFNHILWEDLPVPYDNEYNIVNLDMELTFSNTLKFVNGVRFNDYEFNNTDSQVGYFCTMHWLCNPSTTFYLGYKSTEEEVLDVRNKISESYWFKISKTF